MSEHVETALYCVHRDQLESAQVFATLALVEQQRAANLIALAALRVESLEQVPATVGSSLEALVWMRNEAAQLIGVDL